MSTYTQVLYHIVFSTKDRHPVLTQSHREDLLKYIGGILRNKLCHLYRINATTEHLHILCSLHPTVSLADLVREIKTGTSSWIKKNDAFPGFSRWQDGDAAFTLSVRDKETVSEYIRNQDKHHHVCDFRSELRGLLNRREFDMMTGFCRSSAFRSAPSGPEAGIRIHVRGLAPTATKIVPLRGTETSRRPAVHRGMVNREPVILPLCVHDSREIGEKDHETNLPRL